MPDSDDALSYGWCSLTGVGATGTLIHSIYPGQGIDDVWHNDPIGPEGLIFPIERSRMPALVGVQWIRVDVRDMVNHHASIAIPADLAEALRGGA